MNSTLPKHLAESDGNDDHDDDDDELHPDDKDPTTTTITNTTITNTTTRTPGTAPSSSSSTISENASALIISATDKAGMKGLDRTKIDAIILRESGSSKYMQQQRKRDEKVNRRIGQLKEKLFHANPNEYANTESIEAKVRDYQRQTCQHQHNTTVRATCVVVDMDMFYMACELLTKPELESVPACVGRGMILTSNYEARKYGVRSAMPGFIGDKLVQELSGGTKTLTHVPSNYKLYQEKSKVTMQCLREYDPNMKCYSLDEAYLDLAPYLAQYLKGKTEWDKVMNTKENKRYYCPMNADAIHEQVQAALLSPHTNEWEIKNGRLTEKPKIDPHLQLQQYSPHTCTQVIREIVSHMRRRVKDVTDGLTCSAGIAPNFMLAKIASDYNKPNGQYLVDPQEVLDFVHPLPVRKIPGIGRVTEKLLQHVLGIQTVKELYEKRGLVAFLFQPATSSFLLRASVGCGSSSHSSAANAFGASDDADSGNNVDGTTTETNNHTNNSSSSSNSKDSHQKGISRERTFRAESNWANLNSKLEDIARMISKDMQRKQVLAHTITVKVKLDSFDVWSRAKSMPRNVYVQSAKDLVDIATVLFQQIRANCPPKQKTSFRCRLLGIRCSNLIEQQEYESQGGLLQQSNAMARFFAVAKPSPPPASSSSDTKTTTSTTTRTNKNNVCTNIYHAKAPPSSVVVEPVPSDCTSKASAAAIHATSGTTDITPVVSLSAAAKPVTPYGPKSVADHDSFNKNSENKNLGPVSNSTQAKNTSMKSPHGTHHLKASTQKQPMSEGTAKPTETSSAKVKVSPGSGGGGGTSATAIHLDDMAPVVVVERAECPLCKQQIVSSDNDALNRHIDTCLNASTIRSAVRAASASGEPKAKKRKRLTDFW